MGSEVRGSQTLGDKLRVSCVSFVSGGEDVKQLGLCCVLIAPSRMIDAIPESRRCGPHLGTSTSTFASSAARLKASSTNNHYPVIVADKLSPTIDLCESCDNKSAWLRAPFRSPEHNLDDPSPQTRLARLNDYRHNQEFLHYRLARCSAMSVPTYSIMLTSQNSRSPAQPSFIDLHSQLVRESAFDPRNPRTFEFRL